MSQRSTSTFQTSLPQKHEKSAIFTDEILPVTQAPSYCSSRLGLTLLAVCLLLPILLIQSTNHFASFSLFHRAPKSTVSSDFDKTLVVQRGSHYVATDDAVHNFAQLNSVPDETNVGNFVWQAGGLSLIARDGQSHIYCQDHRDACVVQHPAHARVVHYIPCSYMLADKNMAAARPSLVARMVALAANMSRFGEQFLLVGIGTQASFQTDPRKNDFAMADAIDVTPRSYKLVEEGVTMMRTLQKMKTTVFFRGAFSNSVAKNAGYTLGVETGCPSLMLNKNVRLGEELQTKYDAVSKRIGDTSLKVAVNLAAGMFKLKAFYLGIMNRYPNSVLYLQSRQEAGYFERNGIPFSRMRYYPHNVENWVLNLTSMDVAIGSRIHGSMAALAAALPLYIVAPDFRVLEMAQAMHIPCTHLYDKSLQSEDHLDIAKIVKNIAFNGKQFDKNRCKIARIYEAHLGQHGIQLASHVRQIARIC